MSASRVRSEAIDRFVQLVREYRSLMDELRPGQFQQLLARCSILLPQIYAAGLTLPDMDTGEELPDAEVASPMAALLEVTGEADSYQMVFDPAADFETVTGSMADDLADIYLDLVGPLLTYEAGHLAAAVWQWKFNVQGHCGMHIVNLLPPIHRLLQDS